jgi:hypothetical protein
MNEVQSLRAEEQLHHAIIAFAAYSVAEKPPRHTNLGSRNSLPDLVTPRLAPVSSRKNNVVRWLLQFCSDL